MANAQPVRVESIGRVMGAVYDQGLTFEEAMSWTQPLKLSPLLPVPIVKNVEPGKPNQSWIADFPLKEPTGAKCYQWADL
eukprot:6504938-Karenia_brevis.AAC.1